MLKVVVLNFFPAFSPAMSGGELRAGGLYRALSTIYDVTMLTSTDFGARFETIEHTAHFRELRFPKDDFWRSAYAALEHSGVRGDLSGLAFALAVSDPSCHLRHTARELAASSDLVVHEFPFSEPVFSDGCPVPEIYNSHNFELSLFSSIIRGTGTEPAFLKLMRLESNLTRRASRVFATSSADADKFRLFYGVDAAKLGVCPNGFDDIELAPVVAARTARPEPVSAQPRLLFMGSGHYPNVEAAAFLVELAQELADCRLILAGGVCKAIADKALPPNVTLAGKFDQAQKLELLGSADVFLNPVMLGSGTSLKALEVLGAHVPMVSTPEGVRGLDLTPGIHCEICARSEFASAIRRLLVDSRHRQDIADAGLARARRMFSWNHIARTFAETVERPLPPREEPRPLVLALNDYSVLQPGSGGISRIRNLLCNIDCDVVLVSFGAAYDMVMISDAVLHVTVPKVAAHQAFEAAVNDGQAVSVNDGVASLFAGSNRVLTAIVSEIARRAQVVILEHPYMGPVLDVCAQVHPGIAVVYSAHNVEATHKVSILGRHKHGPMWASFIADLEKRIVARADLIVCCTQDDMAHFAAFGRRTLLVANGCTIPADELLTSERLQDVPTGRPVRLGFLGSAHGPNVVAAEFIIQKLAPAFPDAQFEFVGGVCSAVTTTPPANVMLHGLLSEAAKTTTMSGWDVALNPVESGGGSSLKLPDYMAHGLPTLNTPTGARGFPVERHEAGLIAELTNFVPALGLMIKNPAWRRRQRDNARRYAVEELGWRAIAAPYRDRLRSLPSSPAPEGGFRLLVVTYRYTEPSLGGAEEYLVEVLKRLRPRFEHIALAAVDVDHVTNHHHFGCKVSSPSGGAARRVGELFDTAAYFKPDELPEPVVLARTRDLERVWTREERDLLAPFVDHLAAPGRLRLFCGFFWPEDQGGVTRRWTSPQFCFLLPRATRIFQMSGYASQKKQLRITLMHVGGGGEVEILTSHRQDIAPHFSVSIGLAKIDVDRPVVLCCEVDEHQATGDHRPFGILLESAKALQDEAGLWSGDAATLGFLTEQSADLRELHEEELRTGQLDKWVRALHETASRRDPATEADFAAVRGPHAAGLQDWLVANAENYDVVLVQGIPFDVIPRTVETLTSLPRRPRIVALPHFHGDDRFYHWQRYYRSFEAADTTLLFSSIIAQQFPSSAHFTVVPGGGVRSDEHGDPTAESRFRDVHTRPNPFFLVLGRKTASKGYEQAIRAYQALRKTNANIDLVLIGPDEDGCKVEGDGIAYLGRQPRDVIRGALGACLALVTMSRSESFGIVLCEAWLFGKPVIANRACYSFRELVHEGETGLLVQSDDELTGAMRYLMERPGDRVRMGDAGFDKVLNQYTWEKVADACFDALAPWRSCSAQNKTSTRAAAE